METSERAIKVKHSSLPWYIKETRIGRIIMSGSSEVVWVEKSGENGALNSKFIVTACNSYEHLKEVNEELVTWAKEIINVLRNGSDKEGTLAGLVQQSDNLILKAEGSK